MLALWLEHKFSKAQILDLYLNRVYFGSGAYGVEAAAQRYFGKSARQLTLPKRRCSPASCNRRRGSRRATIPTAPSAAPRWCIADMAEQKMISATPPSSRSRIRRAR